ncbi:engulfment and cell motility protein 1 [Neocloeon triangulifer]|uniref:engulfment and cell motility protein 1 n=1 Tax=Neocloeon triangulifer TaxID=2078957 RepID=UPI00286F7A63|nr:engulfment and cell motility protein 1 [Neocloeon triangulifer]
MRKPTMPAAKDSNIVKIAVQMNNHTPRLIEFNQKQPLNCIIQELCNHWSIEDAENYALQTDGPHNNYITEKNRVDIRNGCILRLTLSAAKTTSEILHKINGESEADKLSALEKLSQLSTDNTFAEEFINKQGLKLVTTLIESGKFQNVMLAHLLTSFVELMDHGIVSWVVLEAPFVCKVSAYINDASIQDNMVKQSALSIVENVILNSDKYLLVEKEITITNLVRHLQSSVPAIRQNAMALINALFMKADELKKKSLAGTLTSKQVRHVIESHILQGGAVDSDMAHQLYVQQTLLFNLLEPRMQTKMDPQDQDALSKIKELRRIAFDTDQDNRDSAAKKTATFNKDYKKLGFKCDINPVLDFTETPPGLLALDCMYYFARNQQDNYMKIVLENSCRADEHECPFGRTSIELTKLLCSVLQIGEPPSEQGQTYHPLFFTHDHPFEEFFCIGIVLLNKTWKEMRATAEDFVKVMSVVREQIKRALDAQPSNMEKFKLQLQTLTYSDITQLWQQEQINREEWESHARPVVELKEQIMPEIMDLIKQQRLGFLVEGTRFTKQSKGQRSKFKFWYVRLSPNHKVLHYGDCDEKSAPALEELPNKLAVVDIKDLVTGKDCRPNKDLKKKAASQLAFSLILESQSVEPTTLDFLAPDELVFDYWTDGINSLLGKPMVSKEMEKDLDTLLGMEIKLRLLDAEGVDIPQDPPPIPPPPSNYEFCYEYEVK